MNVLTVPSLDTHSSVAGHSQFRRWTLTVPSLDTHSAVTGHSLHACGSLIPHATEEAGWQTGRFCCPQGITSPVLASLATDTGLLTPVHSSLCTEACSLKLGLPARFNQCISLSSIRSAKTFRSRCLDRLTLFLRGNRWPRNCFFSHLPYCPGFPSSSDHLESRLLIVSPTCV